MSAVALQRPLLHHLHLQSHLQLAVSPFCRPRTVGSNSRCNVSRRGAIRFSTGSSFWGNSEHLLLKGKRLEGFIGLEGRAAGGRGHVSLPWVCTNAVKIPKVLQRGIRKSSSLVVEEDTKTAMEPKGSNRKRPSLQPKQLALRTSGTHGSTFISFVQILGTGMDTRDTSASVLLFFDKRRIVFNAGEGLQRFCIEHKIKLSKLDHVFLTRVCSETTSGVPGLLLTLSNTGENGMTVNMWGPSDLNYLVDAMRTFIPNSSVVHANSFGGDLEQATGEDTVMLLEDECVKISAVILRPTKLKTGRNGTGTRAEVMDVRERSPKGTADTQVADKAVANAQGSTFQSAEPWELGFETNPISPSAEKPPRLEPPVSSAGGSENLLNAGMKLMPDFSNSYPQENNSRKGPNDVAVVYICELPEVIGKFDPAKAKALGLRPGPKYGLLQSGKEVMADDEKTKISPSDVMDPSSPGPICLVVDCPTIAHVSALVTAAGLRRFYSPTSSGGNAGHVKNVTCIIHISPGSVTKTPEYQQWMAQFDGTHHLMAGHGMVAKVSPVLKSSSRVMAKLNYICPQVFPIAGLLQNEMLTDVIQDESTSLATIYPAENLLKYRLRPLTTSGVDRSGIPERLDIKQVQTQLVTDIPEIVEASKHLADLWKRAEDESPRSPLKKKSRKSRSPSPVRGAKASSGDDLPDSLVGLGREEMEMVFLGTGSSQPSKYRNVSAIYIHLFHRGGLLLDCGEGTYAQLKRRYGATTADEVVAGLKMVWISHIHADHHTGLARILSVRRQLLEEQGNFTPILVIGPKQLKRYLDAYERLEDLGMEFLDCSQTTFEAESAASMAWDSAPEGPASQGSATKTTTGLLRPSEKRPGRGQLRNFWLQTGFNFQAGLDEGGRAKLKDTLSSLGLAYLVSVPVVHCPHAFGVVLVAEKRPNDVGGFQPGWKLVYSGDTRPCRALVEASRGATVLIHEATFDDAMEEEAVAKNHSMTKEAIETGITAGAYRTVLTHFSQRYPKIPVFNESYNDRTCIAFDMMSANLADLPLLPKLLPALKLLFKDDAIPVDEDAEDVVEQQ
ncbi:ribonuclease Z [Marchantia polymorpha subsp. ruderalis]